MCRRRRQSDFRRNRNENEYRDPRRHFQPAWLGRGASAHHSFTTEYDGTKTFNIKGTVSKVEWTNPHARFYVDTTDEKRQDGDVEHGAGEPERAGAQRLDEPDAEGRRPGDRHGLRGEGGGVSRRRALGRHSPTAGRSSAARPTTTGRTADSHSRPGSREGIVRQLFRKSQVPNPKLQIPMLVFGIGVLGLDFSLQRAGSGAVAVARARVGALGQEVKRPPVRNESGAAAA